MKKITCLIYFLITKVQGITVKNFQPTLRNVKSCQNEKTPYLENE